MDLKPTLFNIDKEKIGKLLSNNIKKNTVDDVIYMASLARELGFEIAKYQHAHEKGCIEFDGEKACLYLNSLNAEAENNVVAALLIADFVLRFRRGKAKRFEVDVFALSEMQRVKESRMLFLATRLAIPIDIIDEMTEMNFDFLGYSEKSELLPMFLSIVRKNDYVRGFLLRDEAFSHLASIFEGRLGGAESKSLETWRI